MRYLTHRTESLMVDAGCIVAVDLGFIKSRGGFLSELGVAMPVPCERALVVLHTDDCWNGVVTVASPILCPSRKLYIGDPGYCWEDDHDQWCEYLRETEFSRDLQGYGVTLQTGGDGMFSVDIHVTELEALPDEE